MKSLPILSCIVLAPWVGGLVLAVFRRLGAAGSRWLALAFSLTTIVLGIAALAGFDPGRPGYQFVENRMWIASLGIHYHLGLDGMSLLLVLLTGVVSPASLLACWKIDRNPRLLGAFFLMLQGCALGSFVALDFFPWFICWELALVPAFFLIRLWGGDRAPRAAFQFIVMTLSGSALLLLGFAAVYAATGTFDFERLAGLAASGALGAGLGKLATAAFIGVLVGLAVKVPVFPLHTWLPGAYAEAPAGVSMFLTGVMSKMGVYGFFRILWPIFPAQLEAASGTLLWFALAGVVLGALAASAQNDFKRMVAYSSINHVNYCLLALFAVCAAAARGAAGGAAAPSALAGALFQMAGHGLSASALFLCVGVLEDRSGGRRGLGDFGGVRAAAPVFAGLCGIAMFASLGLPGLSGFIGEFLIFRGVFGLEPGFAAAACIGLLATAVFLLTFYQKVFHGPRREGAGAFADLSWRERAALAPGLALIFLLGVVPQLLLGLINPLVASWAARLTP